MPAWLTARHLTWIEPHRLAACPHPRTDNALAALRQHHITLLINLHTRPHPKTRLARHGLSELHLPVPDFSPPSPEQLSR